MQPNVVLPLLSSTLSFVFALFLLDQWLERRRSYQLIWIFGMLWYGLSAGTEFLGGAFGWSEPLYRAWYLIGAVYVAAWLGLGTMYLLGKTRFGYGAAFSVLLAGLFTLLSQAKAQYTDTGILPYAAFAIAIARRAPDRDRDVSRHRALGLDRGRAHHRRVPGRDPHRPTRAAIPAPGYALDASGIPVGSAMPGSVRLLTPLFNVTGGFALALGALYSTYVFMPKKRVDPLRPHPLAGRRRGSWPTSPLAPVAITVNLLASIPGAFTALVHRASSTRGSPRRSCSRSAASSRR